MRRIDFGELMTLKAKKMELEDGYYLKATAGSITFMSRRKNGLDDFMQLWFQPQYSYFPLRNSCFLNLMSGEVKLVRRSMYSMLFQANWIALQTFFCVINHDGKRRRRW
ncbi:hypothetical protein HBH56_062200 [Parastagonospora nodorum]|uniref:Uncharacterized protein n=1 Tax=Phaeosphaeria nodorum (strain SN15 / ATCC MYA-4574 / FGSC 10173) TaxID=321614 RepID=A0A7U2HVP0_PHANO|nr:hypothetical protein HBH56_062200 [Parastagonospora nodorum]QRC92039.1 hypothetical protein JI435_401890 [Parastagonospora nodorum SN15]KAH3930995.1 hypothetical protein HBH54_106150 [Parastagonospora nodorum]KAH4140683.1 hypothetical protein HBH45_075560 [Parastagonospora nodorum]KAH4167690.1 hypothetical protein HBH44_051420 [Parastagonospora nodorum]